MRQYGSKHADVVAGRHGDCTSSSHFFDGIDTGLSSLPHSLKTAVLHRAAALLGGAGALRELLGAPQEEFALWFAGGREPPDPIFHRALGVVLDDLDERAGS